MKESVFIYFDAVTDSTELSEIFVKLDSLLLEIGWKYSGIHNMYIPLAGKSSDIIYDDLVENVNRTEWLKRLKPRIEAFSLTNYCGLRDIKVGNMAYPKIDKLKRYRDYYKKCHKFAHGIVVDENNKLRDGYTTYIIANEEGAKADVLCIDSSVKYKKIVSGKHVVFDGEKYEQCSDKVYSWRYELKEPVVPGDILLANTRKGKRFIKVEGISYASGKKCFSYNSIHKFIEES